MLQKLKDLFRPLTHWRRYREAPSASDGGVATLVHSFSSTVPEHFGLKNLLGFVAVFLLAVQVATGVMLSFYYQPDIEQARSSLVHLSSEVTLGWLVRSVHRWAAELLLFVLGLHLLRMVLSRAYAAPRGLNWVVGVGLLLCVLAFRFTGHLLPGDQESYWSAVHESRIIASVPLIGGTLQKVLYGGPGVGSDSLGRFLALHTLVLPWLSFFLLFTHIYLVRKQGFVDPAGETTTPATEAKPAPSTPEPSTAKDED